MVLHKSGPSLDLPYFLPVLFPPISACMPSLFPTHTHTHTHTRTHKASHFFGSQSFQSPLLTRSLSFSMKSDSHLLLFCVIPLHYSRTATSSKSSLLPLNSLSLDISSEELCLSGCPTLPSTYFETSSLRVVSSFWSENIFTWYHKTVQSWCNIYRLDYSNIVKHFTILAMQSHYRMTIINSYR